MTNKNGHPYRPYGGDEWHRKYSDDGRPARRLGVVGWCLVAVAAAAGTWAVMYALGV